MLEEEGFLVSIRGSGTFVPENISLPRKHNGKADEKLVAVVMNNFGSYIFPRVLMGIGDYLFEHGYAHFLRITGNHIAREEQILIEVLNSNVSGLIIEPARSSWPRPSYGLYREIEQRMPCVLTHSVLPGFRFASVGVSDVEGVAQLVDNLVANGHRKIAAICKSDEQTGMNRFVGYTTGLRRNAIEFEEESVLWYVDDELEDLFSDANAHRVLATMAGRTAVVCFNDQLVSRFYPFLERQGVRVPEDISIVGFDDSIDRKDIKPLTTVRHPKEELGRAAAKALLTLIDTPEADVSYTFKPDVLFRETVRNINGSNVVAPAPSEPPYMV